RELLARPERQQHVPSSRLTRKRLADGEHGCGAGRVVVGAEMNLSRFLFSRERVAAGAVPEMIVMGAERHPRLLHARCRTCRRQIGDDVPTLLALAFDA